MKLALLHMLFMKGPESGCRPMLLSQKLRTSSRAAKVMFTRAYLQLHRSFCRLRLHHNCTGMQPQHPDPLAPHRITELDSHIEAGCSHQQGCCCRRLLPIQADDCLQLSMGCRSGCATALRRWCSCCEAGRCIWGRRQSSWICWWLQGSCQRLLARRRGHRGRFWKCALQLQGGKWWGWRGPGGWRRGSIDPLAALYGLCYIHLRGWRSDV